MPAETILVVDDEPEVRLVVATALRREGYAVIEAVDGEDALALVARRRQPIHLLLTDVTMPRVDGYDLSVLIAETHPEVKILFMSGRDEVKLDHSAAFLRKPFLIPELLRRVQDKLLGEDSLRVMLP
jgi:two-component system cell cycle sensor histidine kinase/response regulator CckA